MRTTIFLTCLLIVGCSGSSDEPGADRATPSTEASTPKAGDAAARLNPAQSPTGGAGEQEKPQLRAMTEKDREELLHKKRKLTDEDIDQWLEARNKMIAVMIEAAENDKWAEFQEERLEIAAEIGTTTPFFRAVSARMNEAWKHVNADPAAVPAELRADTELARKYMDEIRAYDEKRKRFWEKMGPLMTE